MLAAIRPIPFFVCCILSQLTLSISAPFECNVNASFGEYWSAQNNFYNFAQFRLSAQTGFKTPPYNISFDESSDLQISSLVGFDSTTDMAGNELFISGFWESITTDPSLAVGAVFKSNISDAISINGLDVGNIPCNFEVSSTIQPIGKTEAALSPVSVKDGKLYGTDNQPLQLHGINWFGMEEPGNSFIDGTWFGTDSISKDFATIVYRLQLLGFNAVRLPMSFQNLYNLSPKSVTQSCNVDSTNTIADSTKDPSSSANPLSAPSPIAPPTQTPGQCNSYLPSDTTINRFLAMIRYFAQNQFYVIIDNHLNLDATAISDPDAWVQYWSRLAASVSNDATISPWVILDLLNEPDSQMLRWEDSGGQPGAGSLYMRAMDAIYAVNPSQVMAIEGTGQTGYGLCWASFPASFQKI